MSAWTNTSRRLFLQSPSLIGVNPRDVEACHKLARELGRPVALGLLTMAEARAAVYVVAARRVPEHPAFNGLCTGLSWTLRDAATAFDRDYRKSAHWVGRAIKPLFREPWSSTAIIAAAQQACAMRLSRRDAIELCREVIASTIAKADHHGR